MMIVRKKRSRVEAFPPNEVVVVNEGLKKSRCVLIEGGIAATEVDPKLQSIIQNRQQQQQNNVRHPDEALQRARNQGAASRSQSRDAAIREARTRVVETKQIPQTYNEPMDKAIFDAFKTGVFSDLLELVKSGRALVDTQRLNEGVTGLMAACFNGNYAVAKELLELGADPDLRDSYGSSARDFAGRFPDAQTSKALLELLDQFTFVYDIYEVDPSAEEVNIGGDQATYSIDTSAFLIFDDATGHFVEYVHHENDDFGRYGDGDESDSNESGYYERHLQDEDEMDLEDDECEDGTCQLARKYRGFDDDDEYDEHYDDGDEDYI